MYLEFVGEKFSLIDVDFEAEFDHENVENQKRGDVEEKRPTSLCQVF